MVHRLSVYVIRIHFRWNQHNIWRNYFQIVNLYWWFAMDVQPWIQLYQDGSLLPALTYKILDSAYRNGIMLSLSCSRYVRWSSPLFILGTRLMHLHWRDECRDFCSYPPSPRPLPPNSHSHSIKQTFLSNIWMSLFFWFSLSWNSGTYFSCFISPMDHDSLNSCSKTTNESLRVTVPGNFSMSDSNWTFKKVPWI